MKHGTTCVLIALLLALSVPVGVARGQSDTSGASGLAHQQFVFAYRLLQRGDDEMAIREFDDFLARFPRDEKRGDALYFRALLERKHQRNRQAAHFLKDMPATRLVPSHTVHLLQGQVHYDLREYDHAAAALEQINTQALEPTVQASVFYLRGLTYQGLGNQPAAAEQFAQVGQLDSPLQARALVDLARTQARLEQHAQAVETLGRALALNDTPTAAEAARLAGDLAYQLGRYDQAIDFYRIVTTRHAGSSHVGPAIIGTLWAQYQANRPAAVLETFAQFQETIPAGAPRVTAGYLAGSAQQQLGEHAKALTLFEAVRNRAGETDLGDRLLYKMAVSQSELGQYEAMQQSADRLLRQYPDTALKPDVDFLLAAGDARQGNPAQGAARLTRIIDAGVDHPYHAQALLQRARLYESSHQLEPAAADYQRYMQLASKSDNPASYPAATDAGLRLIDLHHRLGQYEAAHAAAVALLAGKQLDPLVQQEALYRQGLALVRLGQHEKALAAFDRLLQEHPQNRYLDESRYYRGLLYMTLDRPDDGAQDLAAAAGSSKLDQALRINALRLAAARYRQRGDNQQALAAMANLEQLAGIERMTAEELVWLGQYQVEQADAPQQALAYLEPVLTGQAGSDNALRSQALLLAARALRELEDSDAAVTAFRQVVALGEGHDLVARLELARTLAGANQLEEALAEYAGLVNAPDSALAADAIYESAQLHHRLAQRQRRSSNPVGQQRHRDQAIRLLARLVVLYNHEQLSPVPELAYLTLIELYHQAGDTDAARRYLAELRETFPKGPHQPYMQAEQLVLDSRPADAVQRLERLAAQSDLDPRLVSRAVQRIRTLKDAP